MSCTVMYQPYAMSYSSCDRSVSDKQKVFKFPHAPSPPDSLHSDASSYSSPGPSSGGAASTSSAASASASSASSLTISHSQNQNQIIPPSHTVSRRPLTPCGGGLGNSSASASATVASISSASQSASRSNATSTHSQSHSSGSDHHSSHSAASHQSQSHSQSHSSNEGPSSHRAHYLSANCVVFVHYNGDVSRVVDEHFSRALSAAYSTEKSSKCSPMSTRNFPPSFWNSNYQPSKPLASYGAASAADFYGAAVDYGAPIPTLAHHHQADPWHYPLSTHQSYHHRPSEIPYPAMPSTSRFNAAQYGSFLLAGAAAAAPGAGRFPGMPGSTQCGVKGDSSPWAGSRYHHESLSDLHLADYSAAAAAHYSNMTAGLETTVPESSKDLYWF